MIDFDPINDFSDAIISLANTIINIFLQFIDIDNATGSFFDIFIGIFNNTNFRWAIFIAIVGFPIVFYIYRELNRKDVGGADFD